MNVSSGNSDKKKRTRAAKSDVGVRNMVLDAFLKCENPFYSRHPSTPEAAKTINVKAILDEITADAVKRARKNKQKSSVVAAYKHGQNETKISGEVDAFLRCANPFYSRHLSTPEAAKTVNVKAILDEITAEAVKRARKHKQKSSVFAAYKHGQAEDGIMNHVRQWLDDLVKQAVQGQRAREIKGKTGKFPVTSIRAQKYRKKPMKRPFAKTPIVAAYKLAKSADKMSENNAKTEANKAEHGKEDNKNHVRRLLDDLVKQVVQGQKAREIKGKTGNSLVTFIGAQKYKKKPVKKSFAITPIVEAYMLAKSDGKISENNTKTGDKYAGDSEDGIKNHVRHWLDDLVKGVVQVKGTCEIKGKIPVTSIGDQKANKVDV